MIGERPSDHIDVRRFIHGLLQFVWPWTHRQDDQLFIASDPVCETQRNKREAIPYIHGIQPGAIGGVACITAKSSRNAYERNDILAHDILVNRDW